MQAKARGLVDLSIGSLLRALAESNAGIAQWIQQLIVTLLVTTRASTSSGTDLDSWMADFGFLRLSAVQASGNVTFSRFTATNQALILVGVEVTTTDGTQAFTVIADTTNANYDPVSGGYVMSPGIAAISVPVMANTAGLAGNAQAGTITVISGSIQFVDTVTNPVTFSNGENAESDQAFRARFVLWIASLSKATKEAIGYAITSMQNGVTYTLTENYAYNGTPQPGYFYAVVDDGSGSPSSAFISSAYNAIDAVRGFTVTFGVFGPELVTANVSMVLTTDPTGSHTDIVSLVTLALQDFIAGLSLGQLLPFTQLATIAYGASPLVTNVSSVTLNGSTSDLAASAKQVIRTGTIMVS
ncbi:TPA: baseplate J/gp47 family protein [Yersinia enterocolitica]|nr:baseplate J/gp47 family protein [Yersinia enterocolitica]HDL7946970.1 baseplate J/gp47 family protein [Yersinia enterocolitica]HDV5960238.1 baseplate J/gp47 family protein [Yersinia enterocolitica]HEB4793555.1 baseplate J/gp47 family protein [Yersinia enterocolitica]HEM9133103.1 baseplate J/gp47 family protein [Yersinia enterocolitica]